MIEIEGYFLFNDCSATHDQLLFRCSVPIDDLHYYNRDLLFEGIKYLNIPSRFIGLKISLGSKEDLPNDIAEHLKAEFTYRKVFILETEGLKYSMVANRILYQENEYGEETSIDCKRPENKIKFTEDDDKKLKEEIDLFMQGKGENPLDKLKTKWKVIL